MNTVLEIGQIWEDEHDNPFDVTWQVEVLEIAEGRDGKNYIKFMAWQKTKNGSRHGTEDNATEKEFRKHYPVRVK